ncbi:MAG: hypothetical protein MUP76_08790, partial [Acidimicrobiia bacterium]|nr:hypothetical protein [Acidimicrobiia bacterium]
LELASGSHQLRAVSGDVNLAKVFDLGEESWAVLDFWYSATEDAAPYFSWRIQSEPVAFG